MRRELELAVVLRVQADFYATPQPPLFSCAFRGTGFKSVLAANLRVTLLDMIEKEIEEAGILIEEYWLTWRLHGRSVTLDRGQ
jgi:hypothetical protein